MLKELKEAVFAWGYKFFRCAQLVTVLAIPYLAVKCQIASLSSFDICLMYVSVALGAANFLNGDLRWHARIR